MSGQELGKSRLNELLITGSWVRVPAGSPSNAMQSEGGTALPSSQKIGLCRDLKERNPKRAGDEMRLGLRPAVSQSTTAFRFHAASVRPHPS